jgi:hypothetical protein
VRTVPATKVCRHPRQAVKHHGHVRWCELCGALSHEVAVGWTRWQLPRLVQTVDGARLVRVS